MCVAGLALAAEPPRSGLADGLNSMRPGLGPNCDDCTRLLDDGGAVQCMGRLQGLMVSKDGWGFCPTSARQLRINTSKVGGCAPAFCARSL